MAHFEKRLSSETKFEGRVITVTLDRVELENGGTSTREVVRHHGGAGVAALNDEGELYLVRQYRYALDRELIEIPAGKLEKGCLLYTSGSTGSGQIHHVHYNDNILRYSLPYWKTALWPAHPGADGRRIRAGRGTHRIVPVPARLQSKTAATYSPTVTQYHRRDKA